MKHTLTTSSCTPDLVRVRLIGKHQSPFDLEAIQEDLIRIAASGLDAEISYSNNWNTRIPAFHLQEISHDLSHIEREIIKGITKSVAEGLFKIPDAPEPPDWRPTEFTPEDNYV